MIKIGCTDGQNEDQDKGKDLGAPGRNGNARIRILARE